jgi:hypothetical protein
MKLAVTVALAADSGDTGPPTLPTTGAATIDLINLGLALIGIGVIVLAAGTRKTKRAARSGPHSDIRNQERRHSNQE